MSKTISVIIPAYNAEKFLAQTLESVLVQTFRDFEVIVVDDGSGDRTAEIARSFGPPVCCLTKKNGGVAIARNTGIEQATGKYLAFLDADDLWAPTKLEKQLTLLERRQEVGLCFTGMYRVTATLQVISNVPAHDYLDFCEALLLHLCVVTGSCSSAMLRRELVRRIGGFDPQFSTCADWEYWLRLSRITTFAPVPEPLVKYRVTPGSMSSNLALVEQEIFAVLDQFFGARPSERYLKLKNHCYSNHWMIIAGDYLHAGQTKESLRCLARGVNLYPPNIVRPLGLPWRWLKRALAIGTPLQ